MPTLSIATDVPDFVAAVTDHLEANEADYSLLLGFLARLAKAPPAEMPFLARYHEGAETLGVAYRTALNVIVSGGMGPAADRLVEALRDRRLDVPGIVGPLADVEALAEAWTRATGAVPVKVVEQMLYELRTIDWPEGIPGRMRVMTDADVDRVTEWTLGFYRDALPHEPMPREEAQKLSAARPALGTTYLWEVDGVPVAMASLARPTRRGITINAVYTPPEHRRHGYASALVAGLSAEGLSRGKEFCVLYTDLSNPTSNAIYQKIGYRPVSRSKNVRFQAT